MSWDSYIDNMIGQSAGSIDKACIIGLDGGGKWTTDGHANAFKLAAPECSSLASSIKMHDTTPFQTAGAHFEGEKYQFLRVQDEVVYLFKKKDFGGVTAISTKTAIVIGHYPEGQQAGNCNKAVGVIADYLSSMNM